MRRLVPLLFLLTPSFGSAKTVISVRPFLDKSEALPCAAKQKGMLAGPRLTAKLQSELIRALLEYERFEIKEREVRPLRPELMLRGEVREFAACPRRGERMQKAAIAIDVHILNARGSLTHVFTSNASVTGSSNQLAAAKVIRLAVNEIARRFDSAMPGARPALPLGKTGPEGAYTVQLIKKTSVSVPIEDRTRRPASVATRRAR